MTELTYYEPGICLRNKLFAWSLLMLSLQICYWSIKMGQPRLQNVSSILNDNVSWNHFIYLKLKIKAFTRDREGHYIMIKGSIQEEDRTVVNI